MFIPPAPTPPPIIGSPKKEYALVTGSTSTLPDSLVSDGIVELLVLPCCRSDNGMFVDLVHADGSEKTVAIFYGDAPNGVNCEFPGYVGGKIFVTRTNLPSTLTVGGSSFVTINLYTILHIGIAENGPWINWLVYLEPARQGHYNLAWADSQEVLSKIADLRALPYKEYLQTEHWRLTRERALQLGWHRCVICHATEHLNVHHRTYDSVGNEDVANDLVVLCQDCHAKFHDKVVS